MTDDTINSILVTEMLSENGGRVDAQVFIKKLRYWMKHSDKSSAVVGPSTAKALELIEAGTPMEEAGSTGTTNGAAMKIVPIGLLAGYNCKEEWIPAICSTRSLNCADPHILLPAP